MAVMLALPMTAQAYNYAGYRWGGSYPVVGVDSSGLLLTSWRSATTDAMNGWNDAGAKFGLVNQPGSSNTMGYYYEANTTTLAYARAYRKYIWWGDVVRATIMVNNLHNYNPPYTSGTWVDLRTVLRHEFGHWLVLNHSDDYNAVMYRSIPPNTIKGIAADDRNGIRNIYGTR